MEVILNLFVFFVGVMSTCTRRAEEESNRLVRYKYTDAAAAIEADAYILYICMNCRC
jgi:hypothetical protein